MKTGNKPYTNAQKPVVKRKNLEIAKIWLILKSRKNIEQSNWRTKWEC